MLKWLRWVLFRRRADEERVRQDDECCLFAEVDVARVAPPASCGVFGSDTPPRGHRSAGRSPRATQA